MNKRLRWIFLLVISAIFVMNAIISFGLTFSHFNIKSGLSSDDTQLLVMWHDIRTHGLKIISSWVMPSDNFYFSSLPVQAVLSSVVGMNGTAAILSGWLFYVLNAVLLGMALARITNWTLGITAAALSLSFSYSALPAGCFNSPVSHNCSWLLALLGLNLIVWEWPRRIWPILLGIIVIIGTVNDPWLDAVFTFPLLISIASSILIEHKFSREQENWDSTKKIFFLFLGTLSSYGLGRLLYWSMEHVFCFCVPGRGVGLDFDYERIKARILIIYNVFFLFFSGINHHHLFFFCIFLIFSFFLMKILKEYLFKNKLKSVYVIFIMFLILSVFVTIIAVILNNNVNVTSLSSSRFFINIAYSLIGLGLIGVHISLKENGYLYFIMLSVFFIQFSASGLLENIKVPLSFADTPRPTGRRWLYEKLYKENLTFGIAPYGSRINPNLTRIWVGKNKEKITLLAVTSNAKGMVWRYPMHASNLWYKTQPGEIGPNFMVVGNFDSSKIDFWKNAAVRTFGLPAKTIKMGSYTIWVWNKNLLQILNPHNQ